MKHWMVVQSWTLKGQVIPVRSVVIAKTKKEAQKGAKEACQKAAEMIGATRAGAKPKGDATVLYAMA